MKRFALAFAAMMGAASFANAQMRPEGGEMGLGFRINGLANVGINSWGSTGLSGQIINDPLGTGVIPPGTIVDNLVPQELIFGRYYLNSGMAIRVGLGINSMSMSSETTDSVGGDLFTSDEKLKAFSFGIGLGVEKHFATEAERLDPYAGAHLSFASLGKISYEYNDNLASATPVSTAMTAEWGGGSALGFDLLGGFNYFFSDNMALGAEIGWGFHSVSMGGDATTSTAVTSGGTTITSSDAGAYKYKTGGLGVGSTAGLNFSIFW